MSHSAPSPQEHPFAQYVRILGKGPNLSRPLSLDEARAAMGMIMQGQVEQAQLGAVLCLLRVKTELPEEAAGLALGIKDHLNLPADLPAVDVDWASYAGKSRQLPYYILAALCLAQHGISVFMHGAEGHTAGRVYTSEVLAALGVPVAESFAQAAQHLSGRKFAYMTLEHLSPPLHQVMGLRQLLGLRSPIHTVARMVNPLNAAFSINGVTHPPYMPVHQQGSRLMGERAMAVFKGDGGEVERRPEKPCEVMFLQDGEAGAEDWPALVAGVREKEESLDLTRLTALWSGEVVDEMAVAAIAGTMAIVLRYSGRAKSVAEAEGAAQVLWRDRIKTALPGRA